MEGIYNLPSDNNLPSGGLGFRARFTIEHRPGALVGFETTSNPVGITVGLFCVLGLVLGSPYYLTEAYGFARAVSPVLLFVLLVGVRQRAWPALLAPLSMTVSVGLFFVTPAWRIITALVG